LRQTMVDPWYCLDRFVPEGLSQVVKRLKVRNTKQRAFNNRLSSGTSVGTFAVSAGPYENCHAEAGTKNEPNTRSIKGSEHQSSCFNFEHKFLLILLFWRGSGPPLYLNFHHVLNITPSHLLHPLMYFDTCI